MKIDKSNHSESGQIIVLLAVAFVVILGFAALAIDVGMIFSDRRFTQSAADAAALAGAAIAAQELDNNGVYHGVFTCDASGVQDARQDAADAAIARALDNNFAIDTDISDKNGVLIECGIVDIGGNQEDKYIDITVKITSTVDTAFAHLFYKDAIKNTARAVTRVHPRQPWVNGFAISSLSEDCSESMVFDGNSTVTIHNSGAHSNACLTNNGNVYVEAEGEDAGLFYADTWNSHGGGTLDPTPSQTSLVIPNMDPPEFNCDESSILSSTHGGSIGPGTYSNIRVNAGNDLVMAPGLYCLDGDFKALGGTITGNNVTIYMRSGTLNIGGNVETELTAPTSDAYGDAKKGWLIFVDSANPDNLNSLSILGNAESTYTGTIASPGGEIEIGGTGSFATVFKTQLIGYSVKVHGTSDTDIIYDEALMADIPPLVDMLR